MKILSMESSAISAGVCITDGDKVLASDFQNCSMTHSKTLLPMAEHVLSNCNMSVQDLDGFAVAVGPGSFTGIRIGVATIKGLAMAWGKPCVPVSTLEAMAWGLHGIEGNVCCVMDARAGQVYNALFKLDKGGIHRLCEDRAIKIDELAKNIGNSMQILVGDGAELCYNKLSEVCSGIVLAPSHLRYPSGIGVAKVAQIMFSNNLGVTAEALKEQYLRAPQAERELKTKV